MFCLFLLKRWKNLYITFFLIYCLMEAGLPIIVHFLVADSSQKKRTFSMEDYLSADFWGQDSKKAFRYLYDKYTATLRYFASRYLEDDAVMIGSPASIKK